MLGAVVLAGSTTVAVPLLTVTSSAHSAPSRTTTAQNRQAAVRDSGQLLGRVNLPPGATASAQEPAGDGGTLKHAPATPGTPNLVDQIRWWTVNESPQQVISYVKAHPPSGGNQNFSGSQGHCTPNTSPPAGCQEVSSFLGFTFHAMRGVLGLRVLTVEVAQLKDGSTGVRVDADDVWISVRSASERVPAGVRVIDVVRGAPGQTPTVSKTVVRASQVRRIIDLIDDLPIIQPYATHCPAQRPAPMDTFTFRATKRGPALAQASVRSNVGNSTTGCDAMTFYIRSKSEPALGQARSFLQAVQRLLGVKLTAR